MRSSRYVRLAGYALILLGLWMIGFVTVRIMNTRPAWQETDEDADDLPSFFGADESRGRNEGNIDRNNEPTAIPWIPLIWSDALFYDPDTKRLIIDKAVIKPDMFSLASNDCFDQHVLSWVDAPSSQGQVVIDDLYITKVASEGDQLTVETAEPFFLEQAEDDRYVYISFVEPRAAYKMIVLIDPGHGGQDAGAVKGKVYEKDLNLDISLRLAVMFENDQDILLLMTRTDDTYPTLEDRYIMANKLADYFISVHNNVNESSAKIRGSTTYFRNHKDDQPITSRELAQIIQEELVNRLGTFDRGIENETPYRVLEHTTIPAVIAEIAFISNEEDFARLQEADFRQAAAEALYNAIKRLPFPADKQMETNGVLEAG